MSSEMIFDADLQNFQTAVVEKSMQMPVLVDFWADWCAPCKQLMPVLEKVVSDYQGAVLLAKVNADQQKELTAHFGVRSLPTVKLIVQGRIAGDLSGAQTESQVRKFLEPHVSSPAEDRLDKAKQLIDEGALDQAFEILQEMNLADPGNANVLLAIASLKLTQGSIDECRQIIDSIPKDQRDNSEYKQLLSRLRFAEKADELEPRNKLEQRLAKDGQDLDTLFQLAMHDVMSDDFDKAISRLMQILGVDREFNDGKARSTLIELFDMLGAAHPLVRQYRRQLYALLH
ncbi:tetratricopeptide repeat protein [Hahella sp. CCB-MM4]|uniref:tetratricopeptide repeat protein n=1 Tax=Hahella sp. (strain CCB-MM4) TaxID=1926491 RepID=UPI000B9B8D08|nr:tetratricopeptide repeat protein [Hahella sp. CCB-MM4]